MSWQAQRSIRLARQHAWLRVTPAAHDAFAGARTADLEIIETVSTDER